MIDRLRLGLGLRLRLGGEVESYGEEEAFAEVKFGALAVGVFGDTVFGPLIAGHLKPEDATERVLDSNIWRFQRGEATADRGAGRSIEWHADRPDRQRRHSLPRAIRPGEAADQTSGVTSDE